MNGHRFGWLKSRVERDRQARLRRCAGGDRHVEEGLLAGLVKLRVRLHRPQDAVGIGRAAAVEARVRRVLRRPAPAGEHARETGDVGIGVGLDRLAVDELGRAVEVDLGEPDREELHHLAREVLVGHAAGERIGLLVAQVREVDAHDRARRHRFEQRAVVAERMLAEQVDVVGEAVADVGDGAAFSGYDDDLRQRVLHTLPQLVRCRNRLLPERVLHEGEVGAEQQHVVVGLHIGQVGGPGQRELLVDPAAETERLYAGDLGFGGTEARLHQEARCFIRRRWRHGRGSGCRSRDGRGRRGRWSGRRAAATGAESDGQRTRQQCTAGGAGQAVVHRCLPQIRWPHLNATARPAPSNFTNGNAA